MNIEKMSHLIMSRPEFLHCCERRFETSSYNKPLHQSMMDFINAGDIGGVKGMLCDSMYARPLKGMIFCMDGAELIEEFYQAFNEPVCTYEEYFSLKQQIETLTRGRDAGVSNLFKAEARIKILKSVIDYNKLSPQENGGLLR